MIEWATLPAYLLTIALLMALLVGLGSGAGTAASTAGWLTIGGKRLGQPSEFAKLTVVLMLARVLASELERESNARDLRRFNDMLRDQAKGMGAIGRVV